MSLSDLFGPHPGRPEHPDMRKLTHVLLQHDGWTEDPDFDMVAYLTKVIDPDTIKHVSMQRGLRIIDEIGLADHPMAQAAYAAAFLDGFTVGAEWEQRKSAEAQQ